MAHGKSLIKLRKGRGVVLASGLVVLAIIVGVAVHLGKPGPVVVEQQAGGQQKSSARAQPATAAPGEDLFIEARQELADCVKRHGGPELREGASKKDRELNLLIRGRCGTEKALANYELIARLDAAEPTKERKAHQPTAEELAKSVEVTRAELAYQDAVIAAVRRDKKPPPVPKKLADLRAQDRAAQIKSAQNPEKIAYWKNLQRIADSLYAPCMAKKGFTVASMDDFRNKWIKPHLEDDNHTIMDSTPELDRALESDNFCRDEAYRAQDKTETGAR